MRECDRAARPRAAVLKRFYEPAVHRMPLDESRPVDALRFEPTMSRAQKMQKTLIVVEKDGEQRMWCVGCPEIGAS